MTKVLKIIFISTLFVLTTRAYGHCQVPCGIYGHAVRIVQIEEDITTIRKAMNKICLLYTSPSPRDRQKSRMPSSA